MNPPANKLRRPVIIIWGLLVAATITSWWVGLHHGIPYGTAAAGGALILVITFVKIYLVGMYFMEVRHAPKALVALFVAWTIATGAVTVGLYTFGALL